MTAHHGARTRGTIDHSVTFVIVAILFLIAFPKLMERWEYGTFGAWPWWAKALMIGVPALLGLLLAGYVTSGGGKGLGSRARFDPEPPEEPPEAPPPDPPARG